jgi:hypothetical protein
VQINDKYFIATIEQLICIVLFVMTLLANFHGYAQDLKPAGNEAINEIITKIETNAESNEANLDYTELINDLLYFHEHPLNLNFAQAEDLEKLGLLSEAQIYHFLAYRESYGNLVHIYELQTIEGFDKNTIDNIFPFVQISQSKPQRSFSLNEMLKYGQNSIFCRYQRILKEKEGYSVISDSALYENPNSRYLGSPDKIFLKYGFDYQDRIKFGITAEKDAGEVFLKNRVNDSIQQILGNRLSGGFDFTSFHVSVKQMGFLKALTVGDYQAEFGQGLTLWSGLAFGKSVDNLSLKRFADGIRPNTSANENLFMRGIASTLGYKGFDLTTFYSSHKIDASVESYDSTTSAGQIEAFPETGLHRTPNELLKKLAVGLTAAGFHSGYHNKHLKVGLTAYYSKFGLNIGKGDRIYDLFDFSGQENFNTGLDYSYLVNKFNFFGEISMSRNGGLAQLHGLNANLHPRLHLTLLYRNYQKNYQNYFSNAFAAGNKNANETGLYSSFRFMIYRNLMIKVYLDNFIHHWLKYQVSAPSKGSDFALQIENKPSDKVFMYFRYRLRNKQINEETTPEVWISKLTNTRSQSFRFSLEYSLTRALVMRDRAEYIVRGESNVSTGSGYLVFHDIGWKPPMERFSLNFRYSMFDTDSYDERIYAYENDVLYAFSVPAYHDRGMRAMVMVQMRVNRAVALWIRYSETWYDDRKETGTGLERSVGNREPEIKVQLWVRI